ncbi:hypothetical protein AB7M47_004699 [Bradyrhizobium elkanii]
MISLQSVILTLAVAYAVVGALLLIVLVYARLHWSLKAVVIVVTSAFYFVSFGGMRGLLGWASAEKLPANFKLLSTRIVEPHSLEGDSGSIYLWVEELDEDNRPSAIPRAFRIPYSEALAEQTHTAPRTRSRPGIRKAGGRRISAAATAPSWTSSGSTSRRRRSWRPPAVIPPRGRSWPRRPARKGRCSRRCRRPGCRPRTRSNSGMPAQEGGIKIGIGNNQSAGWTVIIRNSSIP